ncbi:hypothetical protein CONCODRAFT_170411, partial [Conidiobolus coronatus NRRL 28638]
VNNKVFNKLDWINIFLLKIFQDYFNLKELQELSKLSKLTRLKLNPVLFKSIRLLRYTNRVRDSKPIRTFNVKSFEKLSWIAVKDEDEAEKSLNVKKSLTDINSQLQDVKRFANSIFIYDIKRSGYYLYPILANFVNLSVLKIHCCVIQYSIFQKLGECFPKLKAFDLYKVALSKESTSSIDSNEIIFPVNLNYLSIWCVEVTDISIFAEPYDIVFYSHGFDPRFKFSLPNIYLPSLKKLQFLRCSVNNNIIEEFLKTNPELEQLSIDNFSPGISRYFNSIKSLQVDQLDKINDLENLITCQNIKTLKINIENNDCYDKFEKVCLMCPSVEFLHLNIIDIVNYQDAFNTYLVPISKRLPNLKTVELPIYDTNSELLDINHLPQIEKIIFEHDSVPYLDIKFEKNPKLKEIEFRATYDYVDKEKFLEKYNAIQIGSLSFLSKRLKDTTLTIKIINCLNINKTLVIDLNDNSYKLNQVL